MATADAGDAVSETHGRGMKLSGAVALAAPRAPKRKSIEAAAVPLGRVGGRLEQNIQVVVAVVEDESQMPSGLPSRSAFVFGFWTPPAGSRA